MKRRDFLDIAATACVLAGMPAAGSASLALGVEVSVPVLSRADQVIE